MILQRVLMVILSLIFLQIWEIDGIIFGYTLSLGVFAFLVYRGFKEGKIDFGSFGRSGRHFRFVQHVSHY